MKDGIYFVTFSRDSQEYGEGVVVVQDNKINGGDYVCVFKGKVTGNKLALNVTQHNLSIATIFGNIQSFIMLLTIEETENGYALSGYVENIPNLNVKATLRYLGEAI